MSFYKKVLVLKQTESGFSLNDKPISAICRLEVENGVFELFLTVVNIMPKNATIYKLMLVDGDKNVFTFDCGKKPSSEKFSLPTLPNVKNAVSVGLYAVNGDIPITVAFAGEDDSAYSLSDFKRLVAERCLNEHRSQIKALSEKQSISVPVTEPPHKVPPISEPDTPNPYSEPERTPNAMPTQEFPTQKSKTVSEFYDDEAVATANYYEFDQELNDRLCAVKEWDNERIRSADVQTDNKSQKEKNFIDAQNNFSQNEADVSFGEEYCENNPYFNAVQRDLENIFLKFPQEMGLKNIFPNGKWARINYSKNKYYVVGLIKEQDKEKYICYGVPGTYAPTPPKELKGYCTFIPLSIFDLSGEGFWMMFQDAITGDCIKPKPPFDK